MGNKDSRIDTSGGDNLGQNVFGDISLGSAPGAAAPTASGRSPKKAASEPGSAKKKMRLDVRREKSGRGGKTVTVIDGVAPLGEQKARALLKELQTLCGTGGAWKDTSLELQGDQRDVLIPKLEEKGFQAVRSGG